MKIQNFNRAEHLVKQIGEASRKLKALTDGLGAADLYTFTPRLKSEPKRNFAAHEIVLSDQYYECLTVDADLLRDIIGKEIAVVESQLSEWNKELETL